MNQNPFQNLEQVPNKYRKHLALVMLGLKSQEELNDDLARFSIDELKALREEILADMQNSRIKKDYLISLVPRDEHYKLPNKMIKGPEDLEGLEEFVSRYPSTVEVWRFKKEKDGVIGRFGILPDDDQVLEQVWSTNHRDIENYHTDSGIPFVRATRDRWATPYKQSIMANVSPDKETEVKKSMVQLYYDIERNREKIENAVELMRGFGLDTMTFEYRRDSRGFAFIDIDTNDDKTLIRKLVPKRNLEDREER